MRTRDIERIVHHSPFIPFRLTLNDGDQVFVTKPRKAHVSGRQITCVGETHRGGTVWPERLRFIPVNQVVSVAVIEPAP